MSFLARTCSGSSPADAHVDLKGQLGQSFQPSTLESEVVILRAFFSKHSTGQTGQRFLCPQLASETELADS